MKRHNAAGYVLLAMLLGAAPQEDQRLPFEGTKNSIATIGDIDVGCILSSWRIKGVLVCTRGTDVEVCLWVENAYPSGVIEIVRQPYKSHFTEFGLELSLLKEIDTGKRSSSESSNAGAGDSLQFGEVHAGNWVPELGLDSDLLAVPDDQTLVELSYASEIDPIWRSPLLELISSPLGVLSTSLRSCEKIPDTKFCAWTWGSYYPRIGFLQHPSEVMASVMQSLRGGKAGADRTGRVTLTGYDYEPRTGHYIQRLSPKRMGRCVPIGSPLAVREIEQGGGSKYGAYLWLHYGIFDECDG